MKLIVKINLVALAVAALGFAVAAVVSHRLLVEQAQVETLHSARLMMETANAQRVYTDANVARLLAAPMKSTFLPESMPSFAATEAFNSLREKLPDHVYKEAVLNPTNPRDRTADWEAELVNQFRQNPASAELTGWRDTPTGKSLYLARPITIKDAACLACHDTSANAPKTVTDRYGSSNGFGWKLHETVGAQIVSVPAQARLERAQASFFALMSTLAALLVAVFIAFNLMLTLLVFRPLSSLAEIAERVSLGDSSAPALKAKGGTDEISGLVRAFARMRTSLQKAIDLIEP